MPNTLAVRTWDAFFARGCRMQQLMVYLRGKTAIPKEAA